MKVIRIFLLALATMMPVLGTSIIFPTYSTPVLVEDTLILLSADRLELIGLSKAGKEVWKRKLQSKGDLMKRDSGETLLCQGASVSTVNPKDGKLELLFSSEPEVRWMDYAVGANLFWGPRAGGEPALVLFDGTTHACLATEPQGETMAYADADLVILAKGRREKSKGGGYSFSKGWLEAFNRGTMEKIWSVPFERQPWPHHSGVRCGAHVVFEDGSDLMVIEVRTGNVRRSPAVKYEDALGPKGLGNDNGALTYLTSMMNTKDFSQSEQTLYKLSVPDLKVLESRVVKVIEAGSSEKVGDLLITDALYRTACFRSDGTKLWEHFQMHRTPAIDGVIYFSDYKEGVARMGALAVATGEQRIFITEQVDSK